MNKIEDYEATKELLIKMKSKSFLNNDFEEQD